MTPSTIRLKQLAEAATQGRPVFRRFFSKIKESDSGCWVWTGAGTGRPGMQYGSVFENGKSIKAHRFSYREFVGPLIRGYLICHHCDNPMCVNPLHLYQGTPADNVRDAVTRGRHSNGERTKTHCPQGHPYIETNTYVYKGQRQCKTCRDFYRQRHPKKYF